MSSHRDVGEVEEEGGRGSSGKIGRGGAGEVAWEVNLQGGSREKRRREFGGCSGRWPGVVGG